jgi:hypothetical protein
MDDPPVKIPGPSVVYEFSCKIDGIRMELLKKMVNLRDIWVSIGQDLLL